MMSYVPKSKRGKELTEETRAKIDALNKKEKLTLLAMTMESLRGNWTDTIERGEIIIHLCDTIPEGAVPKELVDSIRRTAVPFTETDVREYSVDGRDFRADYEKLWKIIGKNTKVMTKLYNTILWNTANLSFEDLWDAKYHGGD